MKNHIYASIDVGSNKIKLKIIQYFDRRIHVLENIEKSLRIGLNVFEKGYIEHDMVKEITETLTVFKQMMDAYDVDRYVAVATSAFRNANNGRNVIEVLSMKSGVKVSIIEDPIEKYMTYLSIRDNMLNYKSIRNSAILIELNAGSCDVSIYGNSSLIFNEEFSLGTLVLKGIMKELESRTSDYAYVMNEFIQSKTSHIWNSIKNRKIKHFLAIGGEIKLINTYLFNGEGAISSEAFHALYNRIINSTESIRSEVENLEMDWYEFAVSVLVYHTFFKLVYADQVECQNINLRDGLLANMIQEDYGLKRYVSFRNDTYSLARHISKRYRSSLKHCKMIENNALKIYNGMKKHFFFEQDDDRLMRLAATLHEIGKYTRMKDYYSTSFEKIKNLSIIGMTHHQMLLIAYICRYLTGISPTHDTMDDLTTKDHNKVVKLSAILTLSDSLDKSKQQKITIEDVQVVEESMIIKITKKSDIALEKWDFEVHKQSFINTFGIEPIIEEVS